MHMHSLAPVLSATSMNVYIWIMTLSEPLAVEFLQGAKSPAVFLRRGRLGARGLPHHAQQAPVLVLGERPRLHDFDFVADARFVLLVVHIADGAALDVFAV